jgi:hypothetical protein
MIIYLDQNKWIELSQMLHGKNTTARAKLVLTSFLAAVDSEAAIVPVSAIHYMETARISNVGRRSRLGQTMWKISKGATIAGYPVIIRHELTNALSRHFPQVKPGTLKLLGRGSHHAFGMPPPQGLGAAFSEKIEEAMLIGSRKLQMEPPAARNTKHRESFRQHLATLHQQSKRLPKNKLDNWLYAIVMADMLDPLHDVCRAFNIPADAFEALGESGLKGVIDAMPTRRLDLCLHRQVLANPQYRAKDSDLEDWAGVGVAACYCDVVVCEKHMADMFGRLPYRTKARVETDLQQAFLTVGLGE